MDKFFILFGLLVLSHCKLFYCFLNVEELTELKYGIDILHEPLNEAEVNLSEGLSLPSKHGQFYFCKLPDKARVMADHADPKEGRLPVEYPVSMLLDSLKQGACLKKSKGWWTYELCFGESIKQYHSDDGVTNDNVIDLGKYQSDFDWNSEPKKQFKHNKLQKYHTQLYKNGTKCDIHNHFRETEVRYYCDESANVPYIERVDEPSTCSYVVIVKTNLICLHPHTRLLSTSKSIAISCQPLLTEDKYSRYVVQHKKIIKESYSEASELLKKKRDRIKSLVEDLKGQILPISEKVALGQFLNINKDHKPSENEKKQAQETALDFINRFVEGNRLEKLSPDSRLQLVELIAKSVLSLHYLPSADMARIIQFEISSYLEIQDTIPDDFFVKAFQSLGISVARSLETKPKENVKVRVKHINAELGEVSEENEQDPMIQQLEEDIGQELSKAGFTSPEKIEVHFITNKDPEELQMTRDQAQQFKEMLVEVVGGVSLENNEKSRYNRLHANYNMVFKNDLAQFKREVSESEEVDNN